MNEAEILIRDAAPGDLETIVDFNRRMAQETERKELPVSVIGPGVAAVLKDRALGRYFVAEIGERVVGQTMITYEWSDWRNGLFFWLQSVYVHPDARGRGVFRRLLSHICAEARRGAQKSGVPVAGIRLYVEKDNARAQQSYRKLGFRDGHYLVYEMIPVAEPI